MDKYSTTSKPTKKTFNFQDIKNLFELKSKELFELYLEYIFPDLSSYNDKTLLGVSSTKFIDFLKLPIFICEKLFVLIKEKNEKYLSLECLKNFLCKLYFGTYKETVEIIFKLYDFDHDGLVIKEDIKMLLSFLPLKTDSTKIEYLYQLESLQELDDILFQVFKDRTHLTLKDFISVIKSYSDIYTQIICFLYQKCPFQQKNIAISKKLLSSSSSHKNLGIDIEKKLTSRKNLEMMLKTPQNKTKFKFNSTKFSPVSEYFSKLEDEKVKNGKVSKSNTDIKTFKINNSSSKFKKKPLARYDSFTDKENSAEVSGMKGMIRLSNEKKEIDEFIEEEVQMEYRRGSTNPIKSKFCTVRSESLEKETKKQTEKPTNIDLSKIIDDLDKENKQQMELIDFPEEQIEKNILFESLVYFNECAITGKALDLPFTMWMVLIGQEIYLYNDDTKKDLIKMHGLAGCLIKENGSIKVKGYKFYSFSIIFSNNKVLTFIIPEKPLAKLWTSKLRAALHYQNFFDYYEIIDDIDHGKFGIVKLGIKLDSKEKVGIKSIRKRNLSERNLSLVMREIEILKICKHPFIVQFIDHFENSEYIFIVMEYFENGSLKKYLKKMKYTINEKIAAKIAYQVGIGLKYLHQFGIVHRDIKPENIMVANAGENFMVKLLDFGLSKILGATESASEGCGTLLYIAPEVINSKAYNHLIDIWSMGVMLYLMLSGDFPFESDNDFKLKKQILMIDIEFNGSLWRQRSESSIELIKRCLEKNPKKRCSIDQLLESKWLQELNPENKEEEK